MEIRETKNAATTLELLADLQDLHHQLYPEFYKPFDKVAAEQEILECLADENQHFFIAVLDDTPAGFLWLVDKPYRENALMTMPASCHVEALVTRKDKQKQGIGKQLMAFAEKYAHQNQKALLTLSYWYSNDMDAYYAKMGFEKHMIQMHKKLS